MPRNKRVTEGDILKGILKQQRITQHQLAARIGYGRTILNLQLSLPVLSDDLKEKVIKELGLPSDTFYSPEDSAEAPVAAPANESDSGEILRAMLAQMQQLVAQNQEILNNQRQLFERLAA